MFDSIGNFFKGLFDATATVNNIFAFIASHLIYLLAGALVAFIIILIWSLVLKAMPNWIIVTLVAIACIGASFGIALIVDNAKVNTETGLISRQDFNTNLNNTINDNYINTNGGFSISQINTVQNDDDAPLANDVIIELNVKDYGDYICYYYNDASNIYHNAVFVKVDNDLIYDGILNTSCGYTNEYLPWYVWLSLGIVRTKDLDSFVWETNYKDAPSYYWQHREFEHDYDNLITETRREEYKYCFNSFFPYYTNVNEAKNKISENVIDYLGKNTKFFQKLNNCELITLIDGNEKPTRIIYNTFYTYLWEQIKDAESNTSKLIDVTNLMCNPIPEDLQANYPISAAAKALHPEYADQTNYGVYKCNIAVKLNKVKTNNKIGLSSNAGSVIVDNSENDDFKTTTISGENQEFSDISVNFINRLDCDLTTLNLEENPIVITFTSADKTKKLVIKDKASLAKANHVLLNNNKTWNYEISSPVVVFEGYNGSFTVNADKANLNLNFEYYANKIPVQVGLNLIGSLDLETLDLENHPTKVILSNATKTYQFVFDSNDKINQLLTQTIEPGEYNYTILSSQLIFASDTGTVNISTTNNQILFNYSQNVRSLNVLFYNNSFEESNQSAIRIFIKGLETDDFIATLMIYDKNQNIIISRNITCSYNGEFYVNYQSLDSLIAEELYTYQLIISYNGRTGSSITTIEHHSVGIIEHYYKVEI